MEWESLTFRRQHARLCTMYKITNEIIHVLKSEYLTLPNETRTIVLSAQVMMSLNIPFFQEQLKNGTGFHQKLSNYEIKTD